MAYLPHKESDPTVNLSLNLFGTKNNDMSEKYGYYEQFYLQQPLSENVHLQIYSSKDCF